MVSLLGNRSMTQTPWKHSFSCVCFQKGSTEGGSPTLTVSNSSILWAASQTEQKGDNEPTREHLPLLQWTPCDQPMRPATSHFCHHAFPAVQTVPKTVSPNKPFLFYLFFNLNLPFLPPPVCAHTCMRVCMCVCSPVSLAPLCLQLGFCLPAASRVSPISPKACWEYRLALLSPLNWGSEMQVLVLARQTFYPRSPHPVLFLP